MQTGKIAEQQRRIDEQAARIERLDVKGAESGSPTSRRRQAGTLNMTQTHPPSGKQRCHQQARELKRGEPYAEVSLQQRTRGRIARAWGLRVARRPKERGGQGDGRTGTRSHWQPLPPEMPSWRPLAAGVGSCPTAPGLPISGAGVITSGMQPGARGVSGAGGVHHSTTAAGSRCQRTGGA